MSSSKIMRHLKRLRLQRNRGKKSLLNVRLKTMRPLPKRKKLPLTMWHVLIGKRYWRRKRHVVYTSRVFKRVKGGPSITLEDLQMPRVPSLRRVKKPLTLVYRLSVL